MSKPAVISLSRVFLALAVIGCTEYSPSAPEDPAGQLRVTAPNGNNFVTIDEGTTVQLTATFGGGPADVTWSTDNPAVLSISPAGVVTGSGPGRAAATATLVSDPTKIRSVSVIVAALEGIPLTSGVPVTVSSSAARFNMAIYRIFVPAGSTNLRVTITGGTGDVDLYVRRAQPPTADAADCATFRAGNNELCSINNPEPGTWYIGLELWDPYAGAILTATVTP